MIRRLVLALAFVFMAGCAQAWPVHGVASSGTPTIVPGSATPNTTFNTITPTSHGNPADYGYALRGTIQWDTVPLTVVNGTLRVGVSARHVPTDAELAAGLASNLCSVDFRSNGGAFVNVSTQTANPDASGHVDFNATLNASSFATDGIQQIDAVGHPCTGPDIIAEGPLQSQWGNLMPQIGADIATVSVGDGYTAGNILKVGGSFYAYNGTSSGVATLSIGHSVSMLGVAANTFIDGNSATNATSCVAQTGSNCTGSGQGGTYHVKGAAQLAVGATGTGSITRGTLTMTAVTRGLMNSQVFGSGVASGTLIITPSFTGSISGTTLTVTAVGTGSVDTGYILLNASVIGTTITGAAFSNPTACSPNCTGNGGTGTYAVSASQTFGSGTLFAGGTGNGAAGTYPVSISQTVASTTINSSSPATFGIARSLYVVTNAGGTLTRKVVYASNSGSDINSGLDRAHPVQTIGKLETVMGTGGGKGGVGCLMNGGSFTPSGPQSTQPDVTNGWVILQSATAWPCDGTGDPGGATMTFTAANAATERGYLPSRTMFQNINLVGSPTTLSGGSDWFLAAVNVTSKSDPIGGGGILSTGGMYCTDSTAWFGQQAICSGAYFIRGNTMKYYAEDCFHDNWVVWNNTCDAGGPSFNWAHGTSTIGSPVITNVTLDAGLAGIPISQIFPPGSVQTNLYQAGQTSLNACFVADVGITVTAVNDATRTITLGTTNATANCTGGTLASPGAHGDIYQLSNVYPRDDIDVDSNNGAVSITGFQEGLFLERELVSGGYFGFNTWDTDPLTPEKILAVNGGNELIIYNTQTFVPNKTFQQDVNGNSANETFAGDQCPGGGGFTGAGTNIRRHASGAHPCYTSVP